MKTTVLKVEKKCIPRQYKPTVICLKNWSIESMKSEACKKSHFHFIENSFTNSNKNTYFFQVWKRPIEGASSADGEIKKWSLDSEVIELQTSRTLMAHEQEINSISVSLDNQFVATASQVKKVF